MCFRRIRLIEDSFACWRMGSYAPEYNHVCGLGRVVNQKKKIVSVPIQYCLYFVHLAPNYVLLGTNLFRHLSVRLGTNSSRHQSV